MRTLLPSTKYLACIIFLLMFVVLSTIVQSGHTATHQPFRMVYPTQDSVLTTENYMHLVAVVDCDEVLRMELVFPVGGEKVLDTSIPSGRKSFSETLVSMFMKDVYLTYFSVETFKGEWSTRADELAYTVEDRVNRQKFWESSDFIDIFNWVMSDSSHTSLLIKLEGVKNVHIDVNDPGYRSRFRNMFIQRIPLVLGEQDVTISVYCKESEAPVKKTIHIVYRPKRYTSLSVAEHIRPEMFHDTEDWTSCEMCHTDPFALPEMRDADCFPCHENLTNYLVEHGPAASRNCVICHNKSESEPGFANGDRDNVELCADCHDTFIANFDSAAFIHGPAAIGDCSLCHNPHGSMDRYQLVRSINVLCLDCHGNKYRSNHPIPGHPIEGCEDKLRPGTSLSCTSCHNPHYSQSPELLQLVQGKLISCRRCHPK